MQFIDVICQVLDEFVNVVLFLIIDFIYYGLVQCPFHLVLAHQINHLFRRPKDVVSLIKVLFVVRFQMLLAKLIQPNFILVFPLLSFIPVRRFYELFHCHLFHLPRMNVLHNTEIDNTKSTFT
jgi:hypothetical protein